MPGRLGAVSGLEVAVVDFSTPTRFDDEAGGGITGLGVASVCIAGSIASSRDRLQYDLGLQPDLERLAGHR